MGLVGVCLALPVGQPPLADQGHQHHHPGPPQEQTQERTPTRMSIPDVELVTQDGQPVHFYRDLVKDKVVLISFVFTSCTTVCSPIGANLARLQQIMGDRMGKDFSLISVSVDPVTDTAQRLKAWSAKFNAGPGWTLLTGPKHTVDQLLKALGVFTPDIRDHSPTVLVGNDRTGEWTRAHGLAPPHALADVIARTMGSGGN